MHHYIIVLLLATTTCMYKCEPVQEDYTYEYEAMLEILLYAVPAKQKWLVVA